MSSESHPAELTDADRVAEVVRALPTVVDLHGGALGEVGTYLPGRRVGGVRELDGRWEVHVTARLGHSLAQVSDQVRQAASTQVDGPIDVVIEDVSGDDDDQ